MHARVEELGLVREKGSLPFQGNGWTTMVDDGEKNGKGWWWGLLCERGGETSCLRTMVVT